METVVQIAGICLAASVIAALLRERTPELGLLLTAGVVLVGAAILLESASGIAALGKELAALTGLAPGLFAPLLKVVAAALVSRIGAALCADAGQTALARMLEAAGSVCALGCAVPLLEEVVGLLRRWL